MADIPIIMSVDSIAKGGLSTLTFTLQTLKNLAAALVDLAERGDAASDRMRAFHGDIVSLRKATDGEYSDLQLVNAALTLQHMQLKLTGDQMQTVFALAKRGADQGIMPLEAGVNSLARAMATGRTRSLIPFGFDIEKIEKATDKSAEIMRQAKERAEGLGGGMDTAGDAIARASTQWDNWNTKMAQAFSETGRLAEAITNLSTTLGGVKVSADDTGMVLANLGADLINTFTRVYTLFTGINTAIRSWGESLDDYHERLSNAARIEREDREWAAREEAGGGSGAEHIAPDGHVLSLEEMRAARRRMHGESATDRAARTEAQMAFMEAGGEPLPEFGPTRLTAEELLLERGATGAGGRRGGGGARNTASLDKLTRAIAGLDLVAIEETYVEALDGQKGFEARSLELREQWRDRMIEIDRERGEALKEQDDRNREVEQRARDRWNEDLDRRNEKDRYYAQQEQEVLDQQIAAWQSWSDAVGGIVMEGTSLFGASKGVAAFASAIGASVDAAIAWGQALNPIGGQAFIPHAVAMTAAAAFAFAKAAELGHGGGRGGSGSGASGGGTPSSAQAFSSYTPQSAQGGDRSVKVEVHFSGTQPLSTKQELAEAVHDMVVYAMDSGRKLPARGISQR